MLPLLTESTVKAYVLRSGLSTLVTMWYPATNKGFVNTHVERCHQEISSFNRKVVKILLMTHLGINLEEEAIATTTIGARVRLMWLTNYITNMRN